MFQKKQRSNIFEDAAKKNNVSVEHVIKSTQNYAKVIMYRIKTSNNQQLKDLWDEAFSNGEVPTAQEFVREWLLFEIFNPDGVKDSDGRKIDMDRIYKGDI